MKILFIHPNMPGQYKHLCRAFADDPKNTVVFITKPRDVTFPNVHKVEYKSPREPSASTHRYLIASERSILQGQEVWRMCKKLKDEEGFVPDVVVTHPGWGDALYVKDIFPTAPLLSFFEFYYRSYGADVDFEPGKVVTADDHGRVRTKNITNLLNLDACDWGVAPTIWQRSVHPKEYHHKISVLHDGIDTDVAKPNDDAVLTLPSGKSFTKKDKVVTYIARNFEPYRGFHTFMRAAEIIQKECPDTHILAIGADGVSYGKQRGKDEETWRQTMLREVNLDMDRIHFPGMVSYADLMRLFQISAAHIYLTYPFVLSWSAIESMACGVALVASDTPTVQEVITDGENGLLVDFHSPESVAKAVVKVLKHKNNMADMRKAARQTVLDRYALADVMPLHVKLIEELAAGKLVPPVHKTIMKRHENHDFVGWTEDIMRRDHG